MRISYHKIIAMSKAKNAQKDEILPKNKKEDRITRPLLSNLTGTQPDDF